MEAQAIAKGGAKTYHEEPSDSRILRHRVTGTYNYAVDIRPQQLELGDEPARRDFFSCRYIITPLALAAADLVTPK